MGLLDELQTKYQERPLIKKENARAKAFELLKSSDLYFLNRAFNLTKDNHLAQAKKKNLQQDIILPQIVEATKRCSTCKGGIIVVHVKEKSKFLRQICVLCLTWSTMKPL